MPRVLIATGNPGKLREFEELLAGSGLEPVGFDTAADETGETYAENALIKARAAATAAGLPAIGDDSGLEVLALAGFPGLHSARIAGSPEERIEVLLKRLAGLPRPWPARFVCVTALVVPGGTELLGLGEARGEIVEPRGASGFGYDPVFLVPGLGRTFAELGTLEKHHWSHRGAAVRALLAQGAATILVR